MRIAFAAAKLTVGLRPITKEVVKEHKMKRDEYGVNEGKTEEEMERRPMPGKQPVENSSRRK